MTVCLARKGGHYSAVTVHKYMNTEKGCRMKVLIIGGGGREHAIAVAMKKSGRVDALYCVPGNA